MEYKLGAIKNKKDLRDIQIAQVQVPVSLPTSYKTDISWIPVLNQLANGSCVGQSHSIIQIYNEFKENGVKKNLSARYLYALSKKIDGYAGEGTYPRVTAGIMLHKGCATDNTVINNNSLPHAEYINVLETPEINTDAKPFKIKGYAEVAPNKEALKQALVQNGLVAITISVGNFNNPILPGNLGLHRVVLFGYDNDRFFYRNSWSSSWGTNGDGYFDWGTQEITDALTFLDLPNEIILEARKKYKYFSDAEVARWKMKPELFALLDKMREECGFPFRITSGFRTVAENNRLPNAVENSAHTLGLAADIFCPDSTKRMKMIEAGFNQGIKRMGIGSNFIHYDIDPSKAQRVVWLY